MLYIIRSLFFSLILILTLSTGCAPKLKDLTDITKGGSGSGNTCSILTQSKAISSFGSPTGNFISVTTDVAFQGLSNVDIDLGTDFTAVNICSGKTVFGRAGSAACSSVFSNFIASQAPRKDVGVNLLIPAAVATRLVATMNDESVYNANFVANHNLVPNPKYDTDAVYDDTGIGQLKRGFLENEDGRPTIVCGTVGTIPVRVADCLARNGASSSWSGKKYGIYGEGIWTLVSAYIPATANGIACAASCTEVWRDERTNLLWSDTSSVIYNWFKAAGYSSNVNTTALNLYESRPNIGANCSGVSCQPINPVTVCASSVVLNGGAGTNGLTNYVDAPETAMKANLSNTDGVYWRLPTVSDWKLADLNGLRQVLPNVNFEHWSATSYSNNRGQTQNLYVLEANYYLTAKNTNNRVRCVGGYQ